MPYTIKCATELHPDPRYEFKQDWLIKVIGGISQWLNSIDVGYRLLAGVVILGIALVIGMLIGGPGLVGKLIMDVALGVSISSIGYGAMTLLSGGTVTSEDFTNAVVNAFLISSIIVFVSVGVSAIRYVCRSRVVTTTELNNQVTSDGYTLANKGHSRGGIEPTNLKEQLALEQSMSNPTAGTQIQIPMGDSRWPVNEDWIKMQQIYDFYNGERVSIHYVMNKKLMLIDDFKIERIVFKRL